MPLEVAVVDPEKELWSGEATFVVARSDDGEIGIMPGHVPFVGVLRHAKLKIVSEGEDIIFAVHGGFMEVSDDRVSVLARTAELASDIDIARARDARSRAEDALRASEEDEEAKAALWRAEARLAAAAETGASIE